MHQVIPAEDRMHFWHKVQFKRKRKLLLISVILFKLTSEGRFYLKKRLDIIIENCSQTFSRKTRKGYWNAFKLLLMEDGWIWTSLLWSYQTIRPVFPELEDCLRLPRAVATMPCSLAATLGYKPAHSIACKGD